MYSVKNLMGWVTGGRGKEKTGVQDLDEQNEPARVTTVTESVSAVGVITIFDEDMNVGVIDGKYRFNISLFKGLKLREKITVNYIVEKGDELDWEVTSIEVCPDAEKNEDSLIIPPVISEPLQPLVSEKDEENQDLSFVVKNNAINDKSNTSDKPVTFFTKPAPGKKKANLRILMCKVSYSDMEAFYVLHPTRNEKIRVLKGEFGPADFVLVGDWLSLCVYTSPEHSEATGKIVSVNWTEKGVIIGKISLSHGFHVVKGVFIPDKELTKRGMNLKVGDYCKVTYILSDQQKTRADGVSKAFFNKRSSLVQTVTENEIKNFEEDSGVARHSRELENLCRNKHGVIIEPDAISLGTIKINSVVRKSVDIINRTRDYVPLRSITLQGDQSVCDFTFEIVNREGGDILKMIDPDSTVSITIIGIPKLLGRTQEICIFDFGKFHIGRKVNLRAVSEDTNQIVVSNDTNSNPEGPRRKRGGQKQRDEERRINKMLEENQATLVPGPAAVRSPFFLPHHIPPFSVPVELENIYIEENAFEGRGSHLLKKAFPKTNWTVLDFENYLDRFHMCLWLEELETIKIRKDLDISGVKVHVEGDQVYFDVEYLSETKPILSVGERVRCYYTSLSETQEEAVRHKVYDDSDDESLDEELKNVVHEGCIQAIEGKRVFTKFEKLHKTYDNSPVNITFKQRRTNFKRQHYALELGIKYLGKSFLFPSEANVKTPKIHFVEAKTKSDFSLPRKEVAEKLTHLKAEDKNRRLQSLPERKMVGFRAANIYEAGTTVPNHLSPNEFIKEVTLNWFNPGLNPEQKDAVRRILRGQCRPLPYVIFGPPGTGKSVTVVEAVMQINKLDSTSRILVAVPSNQAADLIAERLAMSEMYVPGDFVRLNGFMRSGQPVPESISRFCADGEVLNSVVKHKIIISTISTAGQFFQLRVSPEHFTHVFIDEAGYATEPESLIACALAAISKDGQVVLSGDPNQLLPVLHHKSEVHKILRRSLLERLMGTELYASNAEKFEEGFNPVYITMLTRSYRLPESLLYLPSKRFYNGNLISNAPTDYDLLSKLNFIKNKRIPLIFQGIIGRSQHKGSPSWCNLEETQQCLHYLRELHRAGLKSEDIGIISLYRKQVDVLKVSLTKLYGPEKEIPKVATIQEFQGGERKVIIITTVLSMHNDVLNNFSTSNVFIMSSKMFNVAITRAKSLLIVIGDPHTLQYSNDWLDLIRYCHNLGVYFGCQLPTILRPIVIPATEDEESENYQETGNNMKVSPQIPQQAEKPQEQPKVNNYDNEGPDEDDSDSDDDDDEDY